MLGDEEQRRVARERAAELREQADERYVAQFAEQIRSQYPGCAPDEARRIAIHACRKSSGRIGRSSAARNFDVEAIELAVKAHVHHTHTRYDHLLMQMWERSDARRAVLDQITELLERWRVNPIRPSLSGL